MNFASWVILLIVAVIIGLAVKATFFGKKPKGDCCDASCCGSSCCHAADCPTWEHVESRCPYDTSRM